jgi:hypothetical protein
MVAPGTAIQCPNCKSPIHAEVHQLVDVGQDPAAKARLLSGSLNFIQCPVCKYEGQLSTPLVYHDPAKELLLTYVPVELGISKNDQERLLGRLINSAIDRLPAEERKGYLLQPQAALTVQGLVERVLEADGVTKEDLDAQRAKIRLFEELLRASEDSIEQFVADHDSDLDEIFFQLGALSLQATADDGSRQAATQRLERALELSTYGEQVAAREAEIRAAAESLRAEADDLTREKLLEIVIEAPNEERVSALASLARPAMDYGFFQLLSEKIEASEGESEQRLTKLRKRILEVTEEIDRAQEARINQASQLLASLAEAQDLDQAVRAALPLVDELFLSVLSASIRAASERSDEQAVTRLREIDGKLKSAIRQSMPPNLQLAQQILETEDEGEAQAILQQSVDLIDDQVLGALISTAERLDSAQDSDGAERMRRLHRIALRLSMKSKMSS